MLTITCDKRWFGHQKETKRFHGINGNRSFTRSPVSKRFCEREPSEMLTNAFDWWKWWAFLLVASIHTELPWEYQRNALLNVFMNYAENKNENKKKSSKRFNVNVICMVSACFCSAACKLCDFVVEFVCNNLSTFPLQNVLGLVVGPLWWFHIPNHCIAWGAFQWWFEWLSELPLLLWSLLFLAQWIESYG